MPNVMVALPNIGGAFCSAPQSLADAKILECRAVTLPRRESRWNLQGCPKLANISQSLVVRSSPYYEDTWRRYRRLTSFFPIVDTCLSCEDTARQSCRFFASCIFSEPRAAHFRHAFYFALTPHHVWKYGRHPVSDRWDYARKKRRKKIETTRKKYNGLPYYIGRP